jgi:hypothetical protein
VSVRDPATGAFIIGGPERPIRLAVQVVDERTGKGGQAVIRLQETDLTEQPFPVLMEQQIAPLVVAAVTKMRER